MSTYQSLEVIPSVKDLKYLSDALKSPHKYIVLTNAHIGNLKNLVDLCHQSNKKSLLTSNCFMDLMQTLLELNY